MKKNKIVVVRIDWMDSMKSSGWHRFTKSKMDCVTVGMLYKEFLDRYVIAMNWSRHGCGDYMEIPKSAVVKVTKL